MAGAEGGGQRGEKPKTNLQRLQSGASPATPPYMSPLWGYPSALPTHGKACLNPQQRRIMCDSVNKIATHGKRLTAGGKGDLRGLLPEGGVQGEGRGGGGLMPVPPPCKSFSFFVTSLYYPPL